MMRNNLSLQLFDLAEIDLSLEEKIILEKYIYDISNPIWKPIYLDGELTRFLISNVGTVKNSYTGKILKSPIDKQGYDRILFSYHGKNYPRKVHRLVAQAFIPNPDNKPQVNHIYPKHYNRNTKCNWVGNLEWATAKENIQHAIKSGLWLNHAKGEKSGKSIYTEEQICRCCKLLEEKYRPSEVSKLTNVKKDTVDSILYRKEWKHISSLYNIPNAKEINIRRSKYTDEQIHEVCRMLELGYKGIDIFKRTKVPLPRISSIKYGHSFNSISDQYNLPTIRNPKNI